VLLRLRQLFAQPRHCPIEEIEVMQIELLDASNGVVLPPTVGRAIGAAHEQPVQHGEEHGAFQRKAVLALAGELGDQAGSRSPALTCSDRIDDEQYQDQPQRERGVLADRERTMTDLSEARRSRLKERRGRLRLALSTQSARLSASMCVIWRF